MNIIYEFSSFKRGYDDNHKNMKSITIIFQNQYNKIDNIQDKIKKYCMTRLNFTTIQFSTILIRPHKVSTPAWKT